MAKKEEKKCCSPCKVCKICIIVAAIIFVALGIWLWKNPDIEGIAQALAGVLVLKGIKKFGHCCPCKSNMCCS